MKEDFVLVKLLKACAKKKDVGQGIRLHSQILERGLLQTSPHIATSLISMYAKCGDLGKARHVLEDVHERDVILWNALISGYARHGRFHETLGCFEKMQSEGIPPDEITFACILKACGSLRAIDKGRQIHDHIAGIGLLQKHVSLTNSLVDMYARCGFLAKAHQLLEELPLRNEVSWSTLIARYVQAGKAHEALDCYAEMQRDGLHPDAVTFVCTLQACGSAGAISIGMKIHDEIIERGLLQQNTNLGNAVIDMYSKCGAMAKAQQVLEELPDRDVISWSSLIAGYAQLGQGHEALNCFEQMQKEGIPPNQVTFIGILKACSSIGALGKGQQIHDEIVDRGFLERNVVIGNALIDMYAKCGVLERAQQVLVELHFRDIISWNALITGYSQQEHGEEALHCFMQLQREGLSPNEITFTCILKACASTGVTEKGKQIHNEILARGWLPENTVLGTALVDMYAKCGMIAKAQQVLENLSFKDTVSWNALIAGYAQEGHDHKALDCFDLMQREGFSPNVYSFSCILKACGSIGAINKGKQLHNEILNRGFLNTSTVLGNALVDMYAKCGAMAKAQRVLEELLIRDSVSWATLITGYAREGLYEEALNAFEQMQKEGFLPNDITLLCVLNACCRAGKPDKAQMYYEDMSKKYSITPKLEHQTCMVAAFGSVGQFDSAISLIKTISCSDHPSVWLVLLDSCRKWGNVKLARFSFDQVIQLGGDLSGSCVLMASIYAEMGMHEEAVKIEAISIRVKTSSRSQGVPCDSMMSPENSCVAQSPVDAHTDECNNFLNNHEQIFHFKDYG